MIQDTISREAARRYYDRLGTYQDWAGHFEGRAKTRALALLAPPPGGRVLNVGVGTGKEHAHITAAVTPDGVAVGLDVSPVMLRPHPCPYRNAGLPGRCPPAALRQRQL